MQPASPLPSLPDPSPRQAGFTLVELLVGMILLAIFGGILVSIVIDAFSSTERSVAHRKAEANATAAIEQLGNDLRAARARDRHSTAIRSSDGLRGAFQNGDQLYDSGGRRLDIHDVTAARPRSFTFQTEANGAANGPECVTYETAAQGGSWSFVRVVRRYRFNCQQGGNGLLSRTLLTPPVAGTAPAVFNYALLVRRQGTCQVRMDDQPNAGQLPAIAAVAVNLSAAGNNRLGVKAEQTLRSSISIRTRQEYDYQFALGCTT